MKNFKKLLDFFNKFRLYSKSYVYLSIGAIIFLVWQISLKLLVINNPEIVYNIIVIAFACFVFFIGLGILIKALIDFIKLYQNKLNQENTNKPIWLYDTILIFYIIMSFVLQ